jgi:protein PhnA
VLFVLSVWCASMMSIVTELQQRSRYTCELCGAAEGLAVYEVPPTLDGTADEALLICATCREQIADPEQVDVHHWRCLTESMWSEVPAVQVMAWRLLTRLSVNEAWAQDLLDTLFLEDEVQSWAEAEAKEADAVLKYIDCNGALLEAGDTVTLVKDLVVKGGGFTAKRGTAVRRILLDQQNATQIEGRVNGQHIVILTRYVKKA